MPWSPCGERASSSMPSIRTCRGTRRSGLPGLEWNACGEPTDRCSQDAARVRIGCAGGASDNSRAHPRRPAHRRPNHPARVRARTSPITYRARNMLSCQGATCTTSSNLGGRRSRRSPSSSPVSRQTWPTIGFWPRCLFTDIVDSTRRAAEMGDRDWHALLDAHDAVVRVAAGTLSRPRGEHLRRQLPRDVRRPAASDPLRHGNS